MVRTQQNIKETGTKTNRYNVSSIDFKRTDLYLAQQDLANVIDASRVMVAQVLKRFREEGFLLGKDKYYAIRDRCSEEHFR